MRAVIRLSSLGLLAACLAAACSPDARNDDGNGDGGLPTDGGPPADAVAPNAIFPAEPIIDTSGGAVPPNVGDLFGPPGTNPAGGPCVVHPAQGALFPRNWMRLLVSYLPTGSDNLFEIRLSAPGVDHELVVYTAAREWKMPVGMWSGLSAAVTDVPITYSVRSLTFDGAQVTAGPSQGTQGTFTIAPAAAPGAIVYWTLSNGTALRGFTVGEETVHDVLRPSQASTGCVGCHASTPDGDFISFTAYTDAVTPTDGHLGFRSVDGSLTEPTWLTTDSRALLARQIQAQAAFSPMHWQTGDRVVVATSQTTVSDPHSELIWIDLEATSQAQGVGWGVIARTGQGGMINTPSFSRDGQKILYGAGVNMISPNEVTNIYWVPYANRQGGTPTALAGANEASYSESYPSFSPDDQLVAFSRVPAGETRVNGPSSEVFVVPFAGGTATRLAANDPMACAGQSSPGVSNSFPKWAPTATAVGDKTYYWVTFSTTRYGGIPQLYVGGVVVDAGGGVTTFPAIYLWNQPANESNHTPAWDVFEIPIP